MSIIADLHLHSRFSRACSSQITMPNLEKYAKIKGLNLLGTGDFTHPLWLKELKEQLKDDGSGILKTGSGFLFVLSSEVANIFTQAGKGRRVHNVILAPSFDVVDQINEALSRRGRLDYDGRPMFGFSCAELIEMLKEISGDIEIIPAHCLLPDARIHTKSGVKGMSNVVVGDYVLTHRGVHKSVVKTFVRPYVGKLYKIIPWYFALGVETTPEHPLLAIKSAKACASTKGLCKPLCSKAANCKKKPFESYHREWVSAENLEVGDFIAYPRPKDVKDLEEIDATKFIRTHKKHGDRILSKYARNNRGAVKARVVLDRGFCKLIGYYISEGYVIRDEGIGFSFSAKEKEYADEVIRLTKRVFGIENFRVDSRRKNQLDVVFFSDILNQFFRNFYSGPEARAWNKRLPEEFIMLPREKLADILRCWWRGDHGYTVSEELASQMKLICLRLGIIPSLHIDTADAYNKRGKHVIEGREIVSKRDLYIISNLSFFEDDYGMLKERCFRRSVNKLRRKHGWMDENYAYLPIRKIETRQYAGKVYNIEVEHDNSYTADCACVHNCWTPWFGVFGSESGFDSLKEAFTDQEKYIHAIETGMSSDPLMNWHISELNSRSIVSFSDSHSFWPWRLGREATIFEKVESYNDIIDAIRKNKIAGTVETDPAYGKYHYDGHRLCNFSCSPEETRRLNGICPVCKKGLTIGVENRVEHLTDQAADKNPNRKPYYKMLPLHEIISAVKSWPLASKKTWEIYNRLIENFGNEFNVLLHASRQDLANALRQDGLLADTILKNREGKINIKPGFDGVYGSAIIGQEPAVGRQSGPLITQRGLSDFARS